MAKVKTKKYKSQFIYDKLVNESDGVYVLKLVGILVLGTFWIKLVTPVNWLGVPIAGIPVGALIAIIIIRIFETNQFDRKIWYAVLIIIAIVSYFVPAGIVI